MASPDDSEATQRAPRRTERDTRQDSRRARRKHRETEAETHGWRATCLPLRASLGEMLRAKGAEVEPAW